MIRTSTDTGIAGALLWGAAAAPATVPALYWGPGLTPISPRRAPNVMEMLSLSHHTGSHQRSPHLLQTTHLGWDLQDQSFGKLHLPSELVPGLAAGRVSLADPYCPGSRPKKALTKEKIWALFKFFFQQKEGEIYVIYFFFIIFLE